MKTLYAYRDPYGLEDLLRLLVRGLLFIYVIIFCGVCLVSEFFDIVIRFKSRNVAIAVAIGVISIRLVGAYIVYECADKHRKMWDDYTRGQIFTYGHVVLYTAAAYGVAGVILLLATDMREVAVGSLAYAIFGGVGGFYILYMGFIMPPTFYYAVSPAEYQPSQMKVVVDSIPTPYALTQQQQHYLNTIGFRALDQIIYP
eukprot:TRINITY_DN228_c0_g2_i1.p2 TRINITY_DN228_c0_g2~~TRINITY_DN228_c0_g2_i1.p2  ORF type:complete len:200 (+),score=2.53 TRINITY_DN228_c0_g2_i1:118-717(+)